VHPARPTGVIPLLWRQRFAPGYKFEIRASTKFSPLAVLRQSVIGCDHDIGGQVVLRHSNFH